MSSGGVFSRSSRRASTAGVSTVAAAPFFRRGRRGSRPEGVVAFQQLLHPAPREARQPSYLGAAPSLCQQPDHLIVPRQDGVLAAPVSCLQLLDAEMTRHLRHACPRSGCSDRNHLDSREESQRASQSVGNRITHSRRLGPGGCSYAWATARPLDRDGTHHGGERTSGHGESSTCSACASCTDLR